MRSATATVDSTLRPRRVREAGLQFFIENPDGVGEETSF